MNCPSFLTAIVGISDFNDLFLKSRLSKQKWYIRVPTYVRYQTDLCNTQNSWSGL